MKNAKKPFQWILMIITILPGPNGEERSIHHFEGYYTTLAACLQDGQNILEKYDIAPGVSGYHFACVPPETVTVAKPAVDE